MTPIIGLSETVRLPRLGKIHLGTRHPEKGYPMKADHFVFPKDNSDYDKLVAVFGEEPKELRILIPVEDEEQWATQYYKAYNQTYGLVCKGDGELAMRMLDVKTGKLPGKGTGAVSLQEMPCLGRDCPDHQAKKCHEVMNFRFLLPEVPGLGVWQIDTGSKNSILNVNSCAKIIKRAFGRISMIPLKLTFEPIQVNNPEDGKKQTVYTLNLRSDVTLAQLADAAREQAKTFMLEAPTLEDAFDIEVEKNIDELWGGKPDSGEILAHIVPDPEKAPETSPGDVTSKTEPPIEESNTEVLVDLDWLKEQMDLLESKGITAYSRANVLAYLNKITGQEDKKVSDAVKRLTKLQVENFTKKIQEAVEMA